MLVLILAHRQKKNNNNKECKTFIIVQSVISLQPIKQSGDRSWYLMVTIFKNKSEVSYSINFDDFTRVVIILGHVIYRKITGMCI